MATPNNEIVEIDRQCVKCGTTKCIDKFRQYNSNSYSNTCKKCLNDMDKIRKKIDNPDFISKAKPEIIQKEKEKFNLLKEKLETIMLSMEKFS